jgi:hypothetical protein
MGLLAAVGVRIGFAVTGLGLIGGGALLCLIPPAAPVGLAMMYTGGAMELPAFRPPDAIDFALAVSSPF